VGRNKSSTRREEPPIESVHLEKCRIEDVEELLEAVGLFELLEAGL